ncbi:MAG: hypothetical protein JSR54_16100, partial [Proteobacteria bacterium]|nr:hypothetical protein [Pseudomonadota bacterium]
EAALAAAGLALVALVGGLVFTTHEARRAERERARAEQHFAEVRALANTLMFRINDAIDGLPGATGAQQQLLATALAYLDGLARDAAGDLGLRAELAAAYAKVAAIQGRAYRRSLGDPAVAVASYTKAIDLRRSIAAARPADAANEERLASDLLARSQLRLLTGDATGAAADVGEATRLIEEARARRPGDAAITFAAAAACSVRTLTSLYTGRWPVAEATARDCIAHLESLHDAQPDNLEIARAVGVAHDLHGTVLEAATPPALAGSLAEHRAALAIAEALARRGEGPLTTLQRDVMVSQVNAGLALFWLGDRAAAAAAYQRARELGVLISRDPRDAEAAINLAHIDTLLGWLWARTGRAAAALPLLEAALHTLDERTARGAGTLQITFWAGQARLAQGLCHEALAARLKSAAASAQRGEAHAAYRDAVARFEAVSAKVTLGGTDAETIALARAGAARTAPSPSSAPAG